MSIVILQCMGEVTENILTVPILHSKKMLLPPKRVPITGDLHLIIKQRVGAG